ncbi:hypothetical protein [Aeromonas caviae]|uniref:Uncharacterized protein n=1 Tax=Aeromonas caviae TaxID=648 RepID=A0AA42VBQ3_AERCA|nr:hypothetical protein [Aeromonas caviae]MDH1898004.1 hypothetical protein [Aeromonas caviae]
MSNFYDENHDLPEQVSKQSKHESFKGKQAYLKRQRGHLNKNIEYYCHKELPIIIGVYSYSKNVKGHIHNFVTCETICLLTNRVLPTDHSFSVLTKRLVLQGRLERVSYYLGSYKPLDSELQDKIKNKREQRYNNNKK